MLGGYVTALLMNRAGVPFLATLPLAFLVPALVGVVLERTLYRRLYGASPLDQVLFTIGLVFMAMPAANYLARRSAAADPSARLSARPHRVRRRRHRRLSAVHHPASAARSRRRCRSSSSARASARSCARRSTTPRAASGLGINVDLLFAITFAVGSGLAGLGGALAADVVGGIDPSFPLKYLVIMLIVVTIGGAERHPRRACSARCCSACSTSPANITFPRSAPSSSMPSWW